MAREWECDDLVGLLTVLASHVEDLVPRPLRLRRLYDRGQPASEDAADAAVSQQNVHRHYDLSNDPFALFLHESMTYSAAAQHRKIDGILDLAAVRAGSRVLEIGTGWGETGIRALGAAPRSPR